MTSRTYPREGSSPASCEHNAPSTPAVGTKSGSTVYRPTLDLYDLGDRYEIKVDLPGATPEHIHASVEENVLSIHAHIEPRRAGHAAPCLEEYGVGDFARRVRLGEDVDTARLSATYELGVLTMTLPKSSDHQPRRVPVTAG